MNFTNLSNHLSFIHYNVQSLAPKLDILGPELFEFDILAFSETWLKPSISSDDLHLHSFRKPERKDRTGDSHGGVIIYVKEDIYYKRRLDLEPRGIECIWIELILKNKYLGYFTDHLILTRFTSHPYKTPFILLYILV